MLLSSEKMALWVGVTESSHQPGPRRRYGYEVGSVVNDQWVPLLLVTPSYPTFKEASSAGEAHLLRIERVLISRGRRFKSSGLRTRSPSDGAA